MRWSPNYFVACRIQDKLLVRMGVPPQNRNRRPESFDPMADNNLSPGELATLAKAWESLEERKRIIRMKPAPRAADVSLLKHRPGRLLDREKPTEA